MDNKLTDNEIIKTLEWCRTAANHIGSATLSKEQISAIFDLINRLQEELNQYAQEQHDLMVEKDKLFDIAEKLQAENERLIGDVTTYRLRWAKAESRETKAKAEAYKECIEMAKRYIKTHCNPYGKPTFDYDTSIKILNYLDNLLKELVGE